MQGEQNNGSRSRGFSFLTDISDDEGKTGAETTTDTQGNIYEFDETLEVVDFLEAGVVSKKVVISLDFGSTHSGFAYALTSNGAIKCEKKRTGLFKEPTCALFDSAGVLQSFGYEARDKYLEMLATNGISRVLPGKGTLRDSEVLYFDYNKLKMRLYNSDRRKNLGKLKAKAANGREVPLDNLVAAILGKLKTTALKYICETENLDLLASDALWVLTVPAIWLEVDKQFMREAACRAKLIDDFNSPNLILALEPECAAIRLYALKSLDLDVGYKLLTLDCGGGAIDFCAIQVTSAPKNRYRFKQLLEPSGGNWGSTFIDDNFFNMMRKLFGKDELHRAMMTSAAQHDIHTGWEELKLKLRAKHFEDGQKGMALECKSLLIETKQSLPKLVTAYNSVHEKQLKASRGNLFKNGTSLILTPGILRMLFDPVIKKIVHHTKILMKRKELMGLRHIILVGGFGRCDYLKEQLLRNLPLENYSTTIIVPKESSNVVMKGAVQFGLQPSVIESRKCALTVGVKGTVNFDDKIHTSEEELKHKEYNPKSKKNVLKKVFIPLVTRGQEVEIDAEVSKVFRSTPGQASTKFELYASRKDDVKFVTDRRCIRLGTITIPVDPSLKKPQKFKVSLLVGLTELFAIVTNEETQKSEKLRIDFNRTGDDAIIIDIATPSET